MRNRRLHRQPERRPRSSRGPVPAGVPRLRLGRDRGPRREGHSGLPEGGPRPRPGDVAPQAAGRQGGHRAYQVGHARPGDRSQRSSADQRGRPDQRRPQRHHRQCGRAARAAGGPGRHVQLGDRYRGHRPPHRPLRRRDLGAGRARRAVQDQRDLRHRRHRRAAPGPDRRRAQRLPADSRRGRSRDVRGQRSRRAGAAHHVSGPPGRWRAGDRHRSRVPHLQQGRGEHGQGSHQHRPGRGGYRARRAPALHAQGDARAALHRGADAPRPPR